MSLRSITGNTLLFVLLLAPLFFCAQDGIEEPAIGVLQINISQAYWNGNAVPFDTIQSYPLEKGESFQILYQNKQLAYLLQCVYRRTASKIHLSYRPIIEMANGDQHYGKMEHATHPAGEGSDPLTGKTEQTVTYNKKTMSTVQLAFSFTLH